MIPSNFIDLTRKRFGQLTVIKRDSNVTPNRNNKVKWICKCDCGKTKSILGQSLRNSSTISCGCYQKKIAPEIRKTHGDSNTKFYNKWGSMIQRCYNSNCGIFSNYGERGITVCDRWLAYKNFKEDMYESYLNHVKIYGKRQTTLERKDVNGKYEQSNCTWATRLEQGRNTRNNILFRAIYTVKGPSYGYIELHTVRSIFAKKYNLNSSCITECLQGKRQKKHKGWTFKYILKEGK